ncbi:TIGR02679 family protein [Aromatoleum anaerobium]|uniref:TIGR02679 family protein n=1 Tax=Aromatoleum anaerobium TaxID=182180 RepID=A0ABX1PPH5_9RHOO|nr:TIGR02679 family protein [Aromatoleum anaerobium]MCK0505783.1 TIGR02679 family protein [Aromatoleum anaerobium]
MTIDARLQRLLGGETLAGLRRRLRQRYERGAPAGVLRLGALSEAEHAALAALAGRPARHVRSMQIDVAEIDAALARAGLAPSLRDALEQLDGPIIDTAAQRLRVRSHWQGVVEDCEHPDLHSALQTSIGLGLLKRLCASRPEAGTRLVRDADQVLRRLPAAGIPRAQLAVAALGDAHALDAGSPVGTLVLTALRQKAAAANDNDGDGDGERARDLWAAAGVLVNELARPALALNLPGPTGTQPGEPAYLSLRSLVRSPQAWPVDGRPVFVCENPNLLAIAADQLGPRCAPLVCTDGMPAAAQRTLLAQLRAAGATLHYHGDFDWPGLRIGNHMVREHEARPWRFSAADYRAAVVGAPRPGRPLDDAAVGALWDDALADAMLAERLAIDEEALADALLADLRR